MAFSMSGGPAILNIELSSSSVLKYLTSIALFMKPISPLQLSFGVEEDVVRKYCRRCEVYYRHDGVAERFPQ